MATTSGGGDQGYLALGSNPWYIAGNPGAVNIPAVASAPTVIQASPNFNNYAGYNGGHHVLVEVDASTNSVATSNTGTNGITGIHAVGYGLGDGVDGHSDNGTGIYGDSINGNGVSGYSRSFYGVSGYSSSSYGVYGYTYATPTTPRVPPIAGVYGIGNGTNTAGVSGNGDGSGFGVYGYAATGIGVYGLSGGGQYPYGVLGQNNAPGGFSLFGNASADNSVAFGGTAYGNALAGQFIGPMRHYGQIILQEQTNGTAINAFIVGPGVTKNAAVALPDGSHGLMHCVEAPEPWFEDFGEGTLAGGKAEIKLDPLFAATVDTGKLHVFLTPHDEAHHLAVKATGGGGFSVAAGVSAEAAAKGKKAADVSGTFTYRVVAKRKDVKGDRLMRVDLPKPIPTPIPPMPRDAPEPKPPVMPPAPKT